MSASKEATSGMGTRKFSTGKSDCILNATLLVPLAGRAEVGLKQVMAAEGDEGAVFERCFRRLSRPSLTSPLSPDVVANASGDPSKWLNACTCAVQEAFLLLRWEAHHKHPRE